ncbi:MAG: hypothetical protein ACREEM_29435, partial [Blastocatellia bacterium]
RKMSVRKIRDVIFLTTIFLYAGFGVAETTIKADFAFEIHGIKKCGALIESGKRMELSLGIHGGQFSKLPRSLDPVVVNEPFAAGVIYSAMLAA